MGIMLIIVTKQQNELGPESERNNRFFGEGNLRK